MTALAILPEPSAVETLPALAEKIELARRLFEDGDVKTAFALSEATYDEAKAAAAFASRMKLSEAMRDKARTMVGLALEISTHAEIGIANEIDRAKEAGVMVARGRPKKGDTNNLLRLEDFGVSKERLFHIRKMREAEAGDPGFIKRTISAAVKEGFEPSRANLRAAIGTASAGKDARGANFYQTPRVAVLSLLAHESFTETIWEPACGHGAISAVLEEKGYCVVLSDLVDRGTISAAGAVQSVGDFLHSRPAAAGEGPDIVTNPPYGECLNAFVTHALRVHKPRKLALLLNLNFQCGFADEDRNFVMDLNPPSRVYAFKRRLPMMHREGYEGEKASSRMNTGWFVWERNADGSYGRSDGWMLTRRIDWAEHADEDCLEPGEGGQACDIGFDEFARETPRRTLDERLDERRDEAREWVLQQSHFDRPALRRAIGIRDGDAAALLAEFLAEGLIAGPDEGDCYRPVMGRDAAPDGDERELYRQAMSILHEGGDFTVAVLQERLGLSWGAALRLFDRIEEDHAEPAAVAAPAGRTLTEYEIARKERAERKAAYRSTIPAGVADADLLAAARWNLEGYHRAVTAGDVHAMRLDSDKVEAIADHLFGLSFDLPPAGRPPEGNGRFSCLSDARFWLLRQLAAPEGEVPMFGQPGRFLIELFGCRVDFRYDGLFGICGGGAYIVDLDKPFFSETGFRSFQVCPTDRVLHAGGLGMKAFMGRYCTEQFLHSKGKKAVKLHDGPFGIALFKDDGRWVKTNDDILERRAEDSAWRPGGFLHRAVAAESEAA